MRNTSINTDSRIVVAVFAVVMLTIGAVVLAPTALAAIDQTDRTAATTAVAPGESVEITTTVDVTEPGTIEISEEFEPAVGDIEVIDDDGATVAVPTDANDELAASWGPTDGVELQYEVTIPEAADPGDEFLIDGTAEGDDGEARDIGTTTLTVEEDAFYDVSIDAAPDRVALGDELSIEATVTNTGGEADTQDVDIDAGPLGVDTTTGVELAPDESESISASFNTTNTDVDEIDVEVRTDDATAATTVIIAEEQDDPVERTIETTEVEAGGTTSVELGISLPEASSRVDILEEFDPAFEDVEIDEEASSDAVADGFDSVADEDILLQVSDVEELILVYDVTVPDDAAEGDEFTFDGSVTDDDTGTEFDIVGDDTVTVIEIEDPKREYTDADGMVDAPSLFDAIADFRSDATDDLGPADLFDLIDAFRNEEPVDFS